MPYNVRMTMYYSFDNVEADSQEQAKELISSLDWEEHLKDVIFDVEEDA